MSTESLHRTSEIVETPSQYVETPKRVNVDVLKQRLLQEKKKEKVKRTIILSSVIVSLGALTMLTYCLLYTSPSPRDKRQSRMPSSA